MARINVEKKALTDPRFRALGNLLQPATKAGLDQIERAFGLYLAVLVWDFAIERGTDTLEAGLVDAIYPGIVDAMLTCQLLDRSGSPKVRVRGFEDADCGWLLRNRLAAKAGGRARADTAKRSVSGRFAPADASQVAGAAGPALASAPAPAPAPAGSSPPPGENTQELKLASFEAKPARSSSGSNGNGTRPPGFELWWQTYRKAIAPRPMRDKPACLKLWHSIGCEPHADKIVARVAKQQAYRSSSAQVGEFIPNLPDPIRYLKRKLWHEEIPK